MALIHPSASKQISDMSEDFGTARDGSGSASESDDSADPYGIGKPVDDDYIDVSAERADISTSEEKAENDTIERRSRASQHADMSHRFYVGKGGGASQQLDDMIDQNAIIEHDGRAQTRTFFRPDEAPKETRQQYKRLIGWQEDKWSGMKNAQRKADRDRTVSSFRTSLDMNSYHEERITHIMEDLKMSHMAHYSSQKVILAIISLVANEENRFIREEDGFRSLMLEVGSDLDEIKKIRKLIRRKTDTI